MKAYTEYIREIENYKDLLSNTGSEVMTTDKWDYNCGGFALGTFDWYRPYNYDEKETVWDIQEDIDENILSYEAGCTALGEFYVNYMCNTGVCRYILSEDDLHDDEYLVAFKASYDDFHYARRLDNGRWFHKMGGSTIQEISEEDVFSESWWEELACDYEGDLFLLAVKNRDFSIERNNRRIRKGEQYE